MLCFHFQELTCKSTTSIYMFDEIYMRIIARFETFNHILILLQLYLEIKKHQVKKNSPKIRQKLVFETYSIEFIVI